ncbi:phosphatidyl synthase [Grosmannia clavigera kw1407]|uniref:Phosphatidyl synthase n=1 Tax=Grosmannia clavigera (strain kw1407 / UAMH 11150) TaxID=655863 RepID=F0X8R0_GROCL|nr:phosphatidyl synthase [Grosmannia clavigera kw1407]EFX06139.1 phosphatidyl synthase [Grosmannia clavigera kw1407]
MSQLQRPAGPCRTASANSFAETFNIARRNLENQLSHEEPSSLDLTPSNSTPLTSPASSNATTPASPATPISQPITPFGASEEVADTFAFAFDIDGVLVRGGTPIPEAIEAMKMLNGENEYGIRVPYIFLTNGGGKTEAERCVDLSDQLQVEVSPGQFICGHTPMRELADKYRGAVLVVGGEGEKCRTVAEHYGFRDVITPGDIIKTNAAVAPFRKLTELEHANSQDLLERGNINDIVIEAIFVFADSRDWASDLQIILDIAMSKGGRLDTRSETFDEGPPIFFSHSDVVWSAAHENVRLGMGALRRIVETIFSDVTGGKKLVTHAFGKPQVNTFEFATRLLQQWRATQHGLDDHSTLDTVYFVGDTPESDVRGTNAMDAKSENTWYSILVKTGVYQDGTEPAYKPRATVPTVLDAVRHGIEREMQARMLRQSKTDAKE